MHLTPRILYVTTAPATESASQPHVDAFCREMQNSALDVVKLQLSESPDALEQAHQQLRTLSLGLQTPLLDRSMAESNLAVATDYLQVLRPELLIFNQLNEQTATVILAARQLHMPWVLDATASDADEALFNTTLAKMLLKHCEQVWAHSARQRQSLIQHHVPAALVLAIQVRWTGQQLAYSVASTLQLWQLLRRRSHAVPVAAPDSSQLRNRNCRIVAIMDEFTRGCFEPEATLLHLSPEDVVAQLEAFQPQLFFIESAWKGVNDSWKMKVSNRAAELILAIAWCRLHQVPVIFWNKEDPVHFSTFLPVAAAADFVFTTDVDCVPRYKAALGHQQVSLLPFAAQTQQHNPLELFDRKDAFNFAGSYYLRYPERQRDFAALIDTVKQFRPVDIYDRNHENPHPHYQFPEQYRPMILGSLPFDQIDKAYKGYRFGINMNTIKQSQTMFARRVFELLASNTVVVSNYSRGVRTLFGDLVICSDDAGQLQQRLSTVCSTELQYRKFRLQGLRKVMQQHTYRHRLTQICQLVFGLAPAGMQQSVAVIAAVKSSAEATAVYQMFIRQTYPNKKLFCVAPPELHQTMPDNQVQLFNTTEQLIQAVSNQFDYCAFYAVEDYYGPDYLQDLILSTAYIAGAGVGKATYYQGLTGDLCNDGSQYRQVSELMLRRALLPFAALDAELIAQFCLSPQQTRISGTTLLSIDEFSYCADFNHSAKPEALTELVNANDVTFCGIDLDTELLPQASLQPAAETVNVPLVLDESPFLKIVTARQLCNLLPHPPVHQIGLECTENRLKVSADLSADQHAYLYFNKKFSREAVNLLSNSQFQLLADDCRGDVRTVFEYWSAQNKKLGHSINRDVGAKHTLAIPAECTMVRLGLRLQGQCNLTLDRFVIGVVPEMPTAVYGVHRNLVLTKQYPAYDDLYRYGFLHSRVRAYREQGLGVDIFRLGRVNQIGYREFENIDIAGGPVALLDATLRTGHYQHVLVHLLDNNMWQVLKKHLDKIKVTVWVHGAEIQVWQRRAYEFERLPEAEVIRMKKLSDQRVKLWQEVLQYNHPHLQFIFVSQYFAEESFADIGVRLAEQQYQIIHNFIDGDLFRYQPKPVSQRLKLLSIRPYASRKYANDLTVATILQLASQDFFDQLDICLVGDGELFEEITSPLQQFTNVKLIKGFMNHAEIAELHQQYGVFLTPTRMDSQGVSRDEAMASGLVPITTAVAAIPEFVDDQCGFVVPAENAAAMAAAIVRLYHEPELFSRLSAAAAQRVRTQSGYQQTIGK